VQQLPVKVTRGGHHDAPIDAESAFAVTAERRESLHVLATRLDRNEHCSLDMTMTGIR
jgi:hypothetical protein